MASAPSFVDSHIRRIGKLVLCEVRSSGTAGRAASMRPTSHNVELRIRPSGPCGDVVQLRRGQHAREAEQGEAVVTAELSIT